MTYNNLVGEIIYAEEKKKTSETIRSNGI